MKAFNPKEYKVVALRECPLPAEMQLCDTPARAYDYWQAHVRTHPYFNESCECLVALLQNARHRVQSHVLISQGTMDCLLVHPREVFRPAVIAGAYAIMLMHHPIGESIPSEADIKVTRDVIRAGQMLTNDVLDHVIVGRPKHCSLQELGCFYQ